MAIYVDPIFKMAGPRGNNLWCHCGTDTLGKAGIEEIYRFGIEKIGMKSDWFQLDPFGDHPHWDLYSSRRRLAVQMGAIELPSTEDYSRKCSWPRRVQRFQATREELKRQYALWVADPSLWSGQGLEVLAKQIAEWDHQIERAQAHVNGFDLDW